MNIYCKAMALQTLNIPEILENIFIYITNFEDFVSFLRVNHIWQIESI